MREGFNRRGTGTAVGQEVHPVRVTVHDEQIRAAVTGDVAGREGADQCSPAVGTLRRKASRVVAGHDAHREVGGNSHREIGLPVSVELAGDDLAEEVGLCLIDRVRCPGRKNGRFCNSAFLRNTVTLSSSEFRDTTSRNPSLLKSPVATSHGRARRESRRRARAHRRGDGGRPAPRCPTGTPRPRSRFDRRCRSHRSRAPGVGRRH